jgi:AcrR family transcriptional regulator
VTGLRERKKLETRQLISETAVRLFNERGFEAVTVDEIAEAANVSKKTVFNYFPTKEDLVFDRLGKRHDEMRRAVRERTAGQSLVESFRQGMLNFLRHLREQPEYRSSGVYALIRSSPTLERRARELHHQNIRLVAAELAAITGTDEHDPVPLVVAQSLLGAHHTLFRETHRLLAQGRAPAVVAELMEPQVFRVFDLLAGGIGDYARID